VAAEAAEDRALMARKVTTFHDNSGAMMVGKQPKVVTRRKRMNDSKLRKDSKQCKMG
jgi:hypothetical protein